MFQEKNSAENFESGEEVTHETAVREYQRGELVGEVDPRCTIASGMFAAKE